MHSIERYGIVALIFLVVTVVAVLMWDGGKDKKKPQELAGPSAAAAQTQLDQPSANDAARRLALQAQSQPGPLVRHPRAAQLAAEAGVELPPRAGAALEAQNETANGLGTGGTPSEQPAPESVVGQTQPVLQPSAPASSTTTRAYVVRAGDTLSHIAQKELGSAKRWNEIVKVNPGLDPAKLRSGKTIQLPGAARAAALTAAAPRTEAAKVAPASSAKVATKSAPSAAPKTASARTHTVGKGENLWKIAEHMLGDGKRWKEIADLNPGVKADKLVLGQRLKLPGGAPAAGGSGAKKAGPKVAAQAPKGDTRVASVDVAERSTRGGKVK
ncbi:MAG: LysM peptidoglycan-binding domain-containing protein [Planctomycetes bacterium]|nr:LysM peptidoglycan-binding domain-containing protein [Planctomycetota bacterium]